MRLLEDAEAELVSLTRCIYAALQVANAAPQDAADGEDFESGILKKRAKPSVDVDSLPVNQKQLQQVICLPAALQQTDHDSCELLYQISGAHLTCCWMLHSAVPIHEVSVPAGSG